MRYAAAVCVLALAGLRSSAQGTFEELKERAAAALASNPAEAAKLYQQAVTIQPSWAEGWFYLAASLYETRQYGESQKAFQHAAKLAPENGTVWGFLGLCEYQMGGYSQALADIRKGEGLGLGDNKKFISSVHNHGALVCLRGGEFGEAMEQLEPLTKIGYESPDTIEEMGVSALGLRMLPAEIPPGKKDMVELAGRAAWAMAAAEPENAGPYLHDLVAKYPNEPGVHYLFGLYWRESDPEKALEEFGKEIEIRREHVPARLQAAILHIKAGKPEAAAALAREAIQIQSRNGYCYMILGRAYLSMGQVEKAIPVLERGAALARESAQPHFFLARAYRKAGRMADAQREADEFSKLKAKQNPVFLTDEK